MANKVHEVISKINGSSKIYLNNFINNSKCKFLDFSYKIF